MSVRLIVVPYHLGHRNVGMGAGPERLLEAGVETVLGDQGHEITVTSVGHEKLPSHEVGATFELNRRVADAVRSALTEGAFPLVLAGNCNSCLGSLSGVGSSDIGITWFDAHGDFNTPETSPTGFLDGMSLNVATGGCWQAAALSVPGFRPVARNRIALLGVRDLDQAERLMLETSDVSLVEYGRVNEAGIPDAVVPTLDSVATEARDVYVHVDLDVLNGDTFSVNEFSTPGGFSLDQLDEILCLIGERFNVVVAGVTAYDPDYDVDGSVAEVALEVVGTLARMGDG